MNTKKIILGIILVLAGSVSAFGAEEAPVAVRTVKPAFDSSLAVEKAGEVKIIATITESGRVVSARVEDASNYEAGRACLRAFRRWRFEPATTAGETVSVRVVQPFIFSDSEDSVEMGDIERIADVASVR